MKRQTDIYHRWVAWSEQDQTYIGRCPDLFRGGVHGDKALKVARELQQVIDEWERLLEENQRPPCSISGNKRLHYMRIQVCFNTLTIDSHLRIEDVKVDSSTLRIDLSDGRSVSAPLVWYPRLLNGTARERRKWQMIGDGLGIHWPDLDEDLSMDGILQGRPSFESPKSFQKWLTARKKKGQATRWS